MQKVLSGNKAAVYAAKLARVEVAAVYPITPQSQISEDITKVVAAGELDCDIIEVEGEHSAMSAIIGASTVGARVFTATSSWGLAYMNEPLMVCAGMRIPAVMVDVTRETPAQRGVSTSRQDVMSVRDSGWLELDPASPQEVLDSVLMAYRLAEDPEILLPVMVASDGFYMSHAYEPVDIPTQEQVDQFLAPVSGCKRTTFADGKEMQFTLTRDYMEKNDTEQIERRMREIQTTVMELISSGDTDEGRFKALNDELQGLQSALNRLQASCGGEKELQHSLYRMNRALEQEHAMNNCEYDDNVVRSLIDTIRVVSGNKLRITFGTGYEYEQSITPNIRGLA